MLGTGGNLQCLSLSSFQFPLLLLLLLDLCYHVELSLETHSYFLVSSVVFFWALSGQLAAVASYFITTQKEVAGNRCSPKTDFSLRLGEIDEGDFRAEICAILAAVPT